MSASVGVHMSCPEGSLIGGRYHVIKEVGCGNFAKVYKCIDTKEGAESEPVAVKVLKREYATDAAFELEILKTLRTRAAGRKVVQMYDHFQVNSFPCFVFKLAGATLRSRKFGVSRGAVTVHDVRRLAVDMIGTLAFLHSEMRMIHTDLKPENILLDDEDGTEGLGRGWTIADFGSASFYRPERPDSDLISTRPYRAPEVVLGMPWSPKADMWSAACILFEVYYGGRLFEVHDDVEHLAKFEQRLGRLPLQFVRQSKLFRRFFDDAGNLQRRQTAAMSRTMAEVVQCEPEFHDFLRGMLAFDPNSRLSAAQAMQHPFIAGSARRSSSAVEVPAAVPTAPPAHVLRPAVDKENVVRYTSAPSSAACIPGTSIPIPPVPSARMPTGAPGAVMGAEKFRMPPAGAPSGRSSSSLLAQARRLAF